MDTNIRYDCIVIGAGPAGSTTATLLAEYGRRVLLLEKLRFPRHHIGESLMPQTYWTFKRLGLLEQLEASGFPRKESVQFVSASGQDSQPFYFTDRDPSPWSTTWQVPRDRFDEMMLENARRRGVEVRQGVGVRRVVFEGDRAVGVEMGDPSATVLSADVTVDATGQSTLLASQLGLRERDETLKNASIYAYFKGALRDEGRNSGATIIIHRPERNGWFWFIPLDHDVASVGVVAPPGHLFAGRGDDPMATLREEMRGCSGIERRLATAECVSQAHVTRDFSYRARRLAGDGWVLVGDAFGFLDPVYSSGVMLALKSGEFAADAIHAGLSAGDCSRARLGVFGPTLATGMHYIRQLVHAFYDREFSFGDFLRAHPRYHDDLVRVLIGDVFKGGLSEMFDAIGQHVDLPGPVALEGIGPPS